MNHLEPTEELLEGRWIEIEGKIVADTTTQRIEELIHYFLTKIATSDDGWEILFVDNRDGRKWELTYRHSDWHGGGPPTLKHVSDSFAHTKYKLAGTEGAPRS